MPLLFNENLISDFTLLCFFFKLFFLLKIRIFLIFQISNFSNFLKFEILIIDVQLIVVLLSCTELYFVS